MRLSHFIIQNIRVSEVVEPLAVNHSLEHEGRSIDVMEKGAQPPYLCRNTISEKC